jgi:hypothetical protein
MYRRLFASQNGVDAFFSAPLTPSESGTTHYLVCVPSQARTFMRASSKIRS